MELNFAERIKNLDTELLESPESHTLAKTKLCQNVQTFSIRLSLLNQKIYSKKLRN